MCRNYGRLEFNHFIVEASDGTIFASARGNGHTYNFIIRRDSVRTQNGEQWVELDSQLAQLIKERAEGVYGQVPTYRTNRLLID